MNNGLNDVIAAAVERAAQQPEADSAPRRVTALRAVETPAPAVPERAPREVKHLNREGLRLAFWLCGFQEAMNDRQRRGERLTEREESLMALCRQDFADLRPIVTDMALERLHAAVNLPTLLPENNQALIASEIFAFETIRNLADRGRSVLRDSGTDTALSLFGGGAQVQAPLAIFQLLFSTAMALVEAFERMTPGGSAVLSGLAAALDSEMARI